MAGQARRILLVDDEQDIVKVLSKRLETAGFAVTTAADGEEALAKVRQEQPELIILDVMIPKLNGYEVCAKLKQDKTSQRIPIIMFTAKGQTQEQLAGLMFGADAYISKASEFDVVLQHIKTLLPQGATNPRPATGS